MKNHVVVGLREKVSSELQSIGESLVLKIRISSHSNLTDLPPCLGWEQNERGKMGPRLSNMMKSMDPTR